jgi:hypothetical protein
LHIVSKAGWGGIVIGLEVVGMGRGRYPPTTTTNKLAVQNIPKISILAWAEPASRANYADPPTVFCSMRSTDALAIFSFSTSHLSYPILPTQVAQPIG